jgi:hypothetical protein
MVCCDEMSLLSETHTNGGGGGGGDEKSLLKNVTSAHVVLATRIGTRKK